MNLNEKLLVFTALVFPKSSFEKLKESNQKGILIVISSLITLSVLLVLFSIQYSKAPHHLSFSFQTLILSLGLMFKIILNGTIIGILVSRVFKKPIKIVDAISIVSISSLTLIVGPLMQLFDDYPNSIYSIIGSILFGLIAGYGISVFYDKSYAKSGILIFGILIIVEFIKMSLLGVTI